MRDTKIGEESFEFSTDPFVRLLEFYVLWAIGKLPQKQVETLKQMTPKLEKTFGKRGAWQEVVSAHMEFPPDMVDQIKDLWLRNAEMAKKNGETLRADDFARMFVAKNFGPG